MRKLALVALMLFCIRVNAAVPDIGSAATITLSGTGIYRVTGTAAISNILGVRDGDHIVLLPGAAFTLSGGGNIIAIDSIATVARPIYFVVANGFVYQVAPSTAGIPPTRTISTTAPLTGGGDLTANRTLAVSAATTTSTGVVELATSGETAAGVVVQGNDPRLAAATTTSSGIVELATSGENAASVVVQGNDLRLNPTWSPVTFSASNFTAIIGTWTVEAADVITNRYVEEGKIMTWSFYVQTSTLSAATPGVSIRIPNGRTAATEFGHAMAYVWDGDGSAVTTAYAYANAGSALVNINKTTGVNFLATTNTTWIRGTITFEIN